MKKTVVLFMSIMLFVACQESLEDRCAREAKEFTEKNCPRAVDKEIVLDSMAFEKATHTISYLYTLMERWTTRKGLTASTFVNCC